MGIIENSWLRKGLSKLKGSDAELKGENLTIFESLENARTILKSSVNEKRYMELEALYKISTRKELENYLSENLSGLNDAERNYIQAVIHISG